MTEAATDTAAPARLRRTRGVLATVGWAAFLACSWTWCIGMFLPVILVNNFTGWAWVTFMLPNVIGAAAMGFVLRTREQSERLLEAHRPMLVTFSLVTLAFQAFFAAWMLPRLTGTHIWGPLLVVSLAVVFAALMVDRPRRTLVLSVLVWLISVAALVYAYGPGWEWTDQAIAALTAEEAPLPPAVQAAAAAKAAAAADAAGPRELLLFGGNAWPGNALPGKGDAWQLLYFTPVFIFGFLLCPYLDISFHRARQQPATDRQARAAFALGFGVLFLVMLLFSLLYAWDLGPTLTESFNRTLLSAVLLIPLVVHLVVQLGFTAGVHVREVAEQAYTQHRSRPMGVLVVLTVLAACLLGLFADRWAYNQMIGGEVAYRLFMSFYGLVFPAYVWLAVIPRQQRAGGPAKTASPARRLQVIYVLTLLAAGPLYWVGFIEGVSAWLLGGLGVVLLARLIPAGAPAEVPAPAAADV